MLVEKVASSWIEALGGRLPVAVIEGDQQTSNDAERIRAGRQEDRHARRRFAVEREDLAVGLRAEFDAADVADARDLAGVAGLDDDVGELGGIVERAAHVDGVLERLIVRRRRRA